MPCDDDDDDSIEEVVEEKVHFQVWSEIASWQWYSLGHTPHHLMNEINQQNGFATRADGVEEI